MYSCCNSNESGESNLPTNVLRLRRVFLHRRRLLQQLEVVLPTRYKLIAFIICILGLCVSVGSHFKFGSITGFSVFVVATFVLLGEMISLRRSQVTKVGDLTYASYLLHFPIQLAMVLLLDALGFSRAIFLAPFAFVLFFAGTFGLAWIVFRVFEMPAQDALRAAWLPHPNRIVTRTRTDATEQYRGDQASGLLVLTMMVLWVSKPRKFQWAAFRFFLIVAFVLTPCFGYLKVQNQWDQRAQIVAARTAEYERHSAAMAACEKVESPPPNRLPGMSDVHG